MLYVGWIIFMMVICGLIAGIIWLFMPSYSRVSLKATMLVGATLGGFTAIIASILSVTTR